MYERGHKHSKSPILDSKARSETLCPPLMAHPFPLAIDLSIANRVLSRYTPPPKPELQDSQVEHDASRASLAVKAVFVNASVELMAPTAPPLAALLHTKSH